MQFKLEKEKKNLSKYMKEILIVALLKIYIMALIMKLEYVQLTITQKVNILKYIKLEQMI